MKEGETERRGRRNEGEKECMHLSPEEQGANISPEAETPCGWAEGPRRGPGRLPSAGHCCVVRRPRVRSLLRPPSWGPGGVQSLGARSNFFVQAGGSVRGSRVQTGNLLGLWQEIIVCEKEEFIPFLPPSPTPIKLNTWNYFGSPGLRGFSGPRAFRAKM